MREAQGDTKADLHEHLKAIERQLRPMIFRDQRDWYDEWVRELDLQCNQHNADIVYKMLQRLGRRRKSTPDGPRPLPLLKKDNGEFAQSHQEMQSIWCELFAKTEAGLKVSEQDLVDLHMEDRPVPNELDLTLLPDLQQVHQLIQTMRNGRVSGPNEILVETLKAGGDCLAKHFLPILAKAILRAREPLEWKGGLLVPLFKGKGDPRCPHSFRSIFVSDCTAKVHHKLLRKTLEQRWDHDHGSLQLGGRAGVGCDLAHHVVQAAFSWFRGRSLSYSATFLDLKAAFYSVHRGALFSGQWDDRLLCLAMDRHGIMPTDWHEIRQQVESDCAAPGLSEHAETVFRDLFHPTYFQMGGVASPTMTTRGTRPGDPVADILFNMLFGIILRQARTEFLQSTDFEWVGQPQPTDNVLGMSPLPTRGLLDMAYVDDAVFMLYSPRPDDILSATQTMASIVHDEARKRGLDVNYGSGKTEVLMKFTGKGSYSLKQKLWHDMQGRVPVVTEDATQLMTVVHSYKHLGSVVQEHAAPVKEISQRITMAKKAEGRIHRSFFAKKEVSLRTKVQVFQATVCSRHLYNMHVLSWLSDKDVARWEDGLRDIVGTLCRSRLGRVPAFKLQTCGLFALAGMIPPRDALHVKRLKYCRKIIHSAPRCLWAMLLDNPSQCAWIQSVLASVRWLEKFGPPSCRNLPHDIQDVLTFISVDPRFHAKVTAAKRSCVSYREQVALAQVKQLDLAISLERCGIAFNEVQVPETKWSCLLCGMKFGSRRGLAMHSVHMHGYKRRARFWVGNDDCMVCKKKYFTRARAILHFQSSPHCLNVYMGCFAPMEATEVEVLDAAEKEVSDDMRKKGWWATKALVPICTVLGPDLPPPDTSDAAQMRMKWEVRNGADERAFHNMLGTYEGSDREDVHRQVSDEILAFVGNSNGGPHGGSSGIFGDGGLARLHAQVHLRCKLFLHVFSGHRRHHDLQDQLEALEGDGAKIYCVSLDICLARENTDMLSPEVLRYWKGKMRDGWIAGVGGGPPCETFTAARYNEGGPPPLRSYFEPWGLPALNRRQWKQVSVGTALVFALLELLYETAMLGLAGFAEHPQFASWIARKQPASIWMWKVIRNLSKLQCCQVTSFDQCVHGCEAKKPTTILTIRMPKFRELVHQRGFMGRCHHQHQHTALVGRESDGSFKTSRAKIYPALLNQDLACAIHEFLKMTAVGPCIQEPCFLATESPAYVPLDHVQKDYYG